MTNGTTKTIIIEVSTATGQITYGNQKVCHAKIGDDIEWESSGPFAIQFLTTTPFIDNKFQSDPPANGKHGKKCKVKVGVRSGTSHNYAVAAYSGGKVYLDANCPVIIID